MKKKLWTGSALFVGAAMLGVLALSGTKGVAAVHDVDVEATITTTLVETVASGINFGTIDLRPGVAETITMNVSTSSTTSSTPTYTGGGTDDGPYASQGSIVQEFTFTPGRITVASEFDMATINVVYPAAPQNLVGNVTGDILTITGMAANSTGGGTDVLTKSGGTTLHIHIGGVLNIPANSSNDTYVGTVPVEINYDS